MSVLQPDINTGIWTRNNFFAYLIYWLVGAYSAEIVKSGKGFRFSWGWPLLLYGLVLALLPYQTRIWVLFNEFALALAVGLVLIKMVNLKIPRRLDNSLGLIGRAGYSIYAFHMCFFFMFTSSSMQLLSPELFSPFPVLIYTLVGTIFLHFIFERPLHLKAKALFSKK